MSIIFNRYVCGESLKHPFDGSNVSIACMARSATLLFPRQRRQPEKLNEEVRLEVEGNGLWKVSCDAFYLWILCNDKGNNREFSIGSDLTATY